MRNPKPPLRPRLPAELTPAEAGHGALRSDQTYTAIGYRPQDLACEELVLAELDRCSLEGVSLAGTKLHRVMFSDCVFVQCDLANLEPHDTSLIRARVTASRLTGLNGVNCRFQDVVFEGCRANLAAIRFSRFKHVVFRDCDLREASFQDSDLSGVRFEGCELTGAQFSGAQLAGARFTDCVLMGVRGVENFKGAIVAGQDLLGLTYSMAGALGIRIEAGDTAD